MSKLRIRKARRDIEVTRDDAGVPHVKAASREDAYYGLGYVHAYDRATQILFARAVASGKGAARIANKPELVETDCFFRRVGIHRDIGEQANKLDDASMVVIGAYTDGVNDGLAATGRSLPMWATRFRPEPWDTQAVLLVGKLLSFGGLAVSQMHNERLLIELINAGVNDSALRELFAPRLDDVDFALMRQVHMSNQLSNEALELITDLPRLAGSNAWAVRPERSATGHALLASDPHLEINRLPAIWYEAVLRWDDQYVMGATLPGCPLFAVARTNRISWGVTYMKGDTIDFFIEDCRPGGNTGWQYRRGDHWYDFRLREEVIQRKGADSTTLRVYENDQGVLDGDPDSTGKGYYLSLAWTGAYGGAGKAISSWLDIAAAKSTRAAMDVVRECTQPTLCFIIADVDGHIGMQGCGLFPKRSSPTEGLLPLPAWDRKHHWDGWLSRDLLPRIYDPPEGFVATANEVQNPVDGPLLVTQFLPDYRKRRIVERLAELPQASLQDMQDLQYDLVSLQARDLLAVFLPHLPDGDLKNRLAAWDCRYDADSHEATLFQQLYINVIMQVFGREDGIGWRRSLYLCTRAGYSTMVLAAIDSLLQKETSQWWQGRDKGKLIRKAAERIAESDDEPWKERNSFHFVNRFFGSARVGRLLGLRSPAMPMAGCHATPFQGHVFQTATREQTFAPSYHMVTDMGTDAAWTNLPGGPSESTFSKFYRTDIDRWLVGEYKCLVVDIPSDHELAPLQMEEDADDLDEEAPAAS